ncbi:MAG: BlaI/MecI/CopY family transcriptional regulator [Bacteroidaceae bacterium]|nr:BlaI/MecI/CopY family transcriptional regulator [Bacteroidaceae bacterium]
MANKKKAEKRKLLTPKEHEIMLKLWTLEESGIKQSKVRDILELFKEDGSSMAYTTLATFIKILVAKKYAASTKNGVIIFIKSKISRQAYAELALKYALADYFAGDKDKMIETVKNL